MDFKIQIPITNGFFASEIRLLDKPSIVEGLNNPKIFANTLRIPYPYTDEHADTWLESVMTLTENAINVTQFAIRNADSKLVGGFSFESPTYEHLQRSEIGYWLSERFWNQGLMTATIEAMCNYGFEQLDLLKITASVFVSNVGSARALEKNGFQLEGRMTRHYLKEEKEIDALAYAKLKPA